MSPELSLSATVTHERSSIQAQATSVVISVRYANGADAAMSHWRPYCTYMGK